MTVLQKIDVEPIRFERSGNGVLEAVQGMRKGEETIEEAR
jgi:hypothetical protein